MFDRAKKLFDHPEVTAADKAELGIANNARNDTMRTYQQRPGKDTKADKDAARLDLEETIARLWPRYFPEEAPVPEGERFKNRKQALNWLQAQGYKISQGKFYQDCEAGFPAIHKDGSVSRYQAMQYGQQLDVERRSSPEDSYVDKDKDEARKLKAEADIKEMQAEQARRELDRNWINRDETWAQMAALVGTLRDSARHHFHVGQAHIIHLAGGDTTRGPEVYEGAEEILAKAFNEVLSAGRIEAVFEEMKDEEDET
ncbi:MAG: hypothetical protein EHM79_02010 [Geobacter sp.]|nr:MAG: hypothetical protein EHM79_02010 [Geobacter sp.]